MDDLATRCGTVAARLDKPHSPFVDEAGAEHLREAAARIARLEADAVAWETLWGVASNAVLYIDAKHEIRRDLEKALMATRNAALTDKETQR